LGWRLTDGVLGGASIGNRFFVAFSAACREFRFLGVRRKPLFLIFFKKIPSQLVQVILVFYDVNNET
jgi:hypothetical protein